jgi:hypothetical protein
MRKMLQITSAALFIFVTIFPAHLSAQSFAGKQEGSSVNATVIGITGIIIVIGVALVFSIIESKKGKNEIH